MFKATATHIVTVGERSYTLTCDSTATFTELLDVLSLISKNVQALKEKLEADAARPAIEPEGISG